MKRLVIVVFILFSISCFAEDPPLIPPWTWDDAPLEDPENMDKPSPDRSSVDPGLTLLGKDPLYQDYEAKLEYVLVFINGDEFYVLMYDLDGKQPRLTVEGTSYPSINIRIYNTRFEYVGMENMSNLIITDVVVYGSIR